MEKSECRQLLTLAKDFARTRTDKGLDKAAEILLHAIDEGCEDPEVVVTAASYLLQGPNTHKSEVQNKAISLVDSAVRTPNDNIRILEEAIHCYELILQDHPEKLDTIITLSLQILDFSPEHINAMITLASHRKHPEVRLSLPDALRMMEWALELDPDNIYVSFALAHLYIEAGRYEKAKKTYHRILSHTIPHSTEANNACHEMKDMKSNELNYKNCRYRRYGVN